MAHRGFSPQKICVEPPGVRNTFARTRGGRGGKRAPGNPCPVVVYPPPWAHFPFDSPGPTFNPKGPFFPPVGTHLGGIAARSNPGVFPILRTGISKPLAQNANTRSACRRSPIFTLVGAPSGP